MDSNGWVGVVVTVLVWWLANVLAAALSYKIHVGYKPIPMPPFEFWVRSLLAGTGLAAMLGLAYLIYFLTAFTWEAPDPVVNSVFWVLLLAYVPAGIGFVTWIFGMEDFVEGVSIFFIQSFPFLLVLVLALFFTPVWTLVTKFVPIREAPRPVAALAVPKGVPFS